MADFVGAKPTQKKLKRLAVRERFEQRIRDKKNIVDEAGFVVEAILILAEEVEKVSEGLDAVRRRMT